MKILIDARVLGTKPSGVGIYILNIIRELHHDSAFRIELVTDVCESPEMAMLRDAAVPIHIHGKRAVRSIALFPYFRFVQKCILECRPELFWEPNFLSPVPLRNPYGRMASTIHDMFPLQYPEHFVKFYPQYFRFGMNLAVRQFDTFIYNSAETKRLSEQYFPKLRNKRNFLGYIPVPPLPEQPVTDEGFFFYCGNLETRKGTDILLRAFCEYRKRGGKKRLRLAGAVRDDAVAALLKDPALMEGAEQLGYISVEQRNREYASCSCFVFPSRAEGFGIPVLEAMNYGKKIIVLDLPIYHEIVGECIEYVPAGSGDGADAFAEALLSQDRDEDDAAKAARTAAYAPVLKRYAPETIAAIFHREFLS